MNSCRFKTDVAARPLSRILNFVTVITLAIISTVFAAEAADIPDIEITLAVDRQLQTDEGVPANLIDVRTRDGIVTLRGAVETLLARERAAELASTIKGVRAVITASIAAMMPKR